MEWHWWHGRKRECKARRSGQGIPMPSKPSVTESKTVDQQKACTRKNPSRQNRKRRQRPGEKTPDFKNEKPKPITHPSKVDPPKIPPPPNAVDYGKGGSPNLLPATLQHRVAVLVLLPYKAKAAAAWLHAMLVYRGSPSQCGAELAPNHYRSGGSRCTPSTLHNDFSHQSRRLHSECPDGAVQRQPLNGQFGKTRVGRHSLRTASQ